MLFHFFLKKIQVHALRRGGGSGNSNASAIGILTSPGPRPARASPARAPPPPPPVAPAPPPAEISGEISIERLGGPNDREPLVVESRRAPRRPATLDGPATTLSADFSDLQAQWHAQQRADNDENVNQVPGRESTTKPGRSSSPPVTVNATALVEVPPSGPALRIVVQHQSAPPPPPVGITQHGQQPLHVRDTDGSPLPPIPIPLPSVPSKFVPAPPDEVDGDEGGRYDDEYDE